MKLKKKNKRRQRLIPEVCTVYIHCQDGSMFRAFGSSARSLIGKYPDDVVILPSDNAEKQEVVLLPDSLLVKIMNEYVCRVDDSGIRAYISL